MQNNPYGQPQYPQQPYQPPAYGQPYAPGPQPGYPQQPPPYYPQQPPQPKKKGIGKGCAIGCGVLALILVLVGVGGWFYIQSLRHPSVAEHSKIDDIVSVADTWQITVKALRTQPAGNTSKDTDMRLIILDVTARNISDQKQNMFTVAMFNLSDGGSKYYSVPEATDWRSLNGLKPIDGDVAASALAYGNLVYRVPKGVNTAILSFRPGMTAKVLATWDLNLP